MAKLQQIVELTDTEENRAKLIALYQYIEALEKRIEKLEKTS